jgi:hypothetical protein
MIGYRHNDRRFPFLWEDASQPPARWHGPGDGPAQYFADTSDGAWAEFLRHEEIVEEVDLEGVDRALWAVELGDLDPVTADLPEAVSRGGLDSYGACQAEASRLRAGGATALAAASAALRHGTAGGWRVEEGLRAGDPADGQVLVLFGRYPHLVGWRVIDRGRPPVELLTHVRHL